MDPVLVPPGNLTEVARAWQPPQSTRSSRAAVQDARSQAAECTGQVPEGVF